ncbi:MAG: ankyrin repeat domain-containing protein [Phycisphaerales bacterium]
MRKIIAAHPGLINLPCSVPEAEPYPTQTPLVAAVLGNQPDTVLELLRLGAAVDQVDGYGRTALYIAVEHRYSGLATVLADAGADPNIVPKMGMSPFAVAIRSKDINLVKNLLANGADVNPRSGGSPLGEAISSDSVEMLRVLVEAGARPECQSWPIFVLEERVSMRSAGVREYWKSIQTSERSGTVAPCDQGIP